MKLPISIIVATATNGVIGAEGAMPWKLSADMRRFKSITMGNPVIMGRKTFEGFSRALPGRHNIVITRNGELEFPDAISASSIEDALDLAQNWGSESGASEVFVLGGGEIYRQSIGIADRLYVTEVLASPTGDTIFPKIDMAIWSVVHEEKIPAGPADSAETRFVIYKKISLI